VASSDIADAGDQPPEWVADSALESRPLGQLVLVQYSYTSWHTWAIVSCHRNKNKRGCEVLEHTTLVVSAGTFFIQHHGASGRLDGSESLFMAAT
jgi:hypothetical protein